MHHSLIITQSTVGRSRNSNRMTWVHYSKKKFVCWKWLQTELQVENVESLVDWKKSCPRSLVCFWQIRMRRSRAWNNNEVKNLSRLRRISFLRPSRTEKIKFDRSKCPKSPNTLDSKRWVGGRRYISTFRPTSAKLLDRYILHWLIFMRGGEIECWALRRVCIWRPSLKDAAKSAQRDCPCETCGSHRLACNLQLLTFFSQKSTEKGKLNNAEKSAAAPSRPKLWCHNNLSSVNEGSKFNILWFTIRWRFICSDGCDILPMNQIMEHLGEIFSVTALGIREARRFKNG